MTRKTKTSAQQHASLMKEIHSPRTATYIAKLQKYLASCPANRHHTQLDSDCSELPAANNQVIH